jgi:putative transposon-encoded protein
MNGQMKVIDKTLTIRKEATVTYYKAVSQRVAGVAQLV